MAARLGELGAYWLELRCGVARCTKTSIVPLRMLAVQRGRQPLLEQVIARMRCSSCGERPALARITDSPIKVAPHETGRRQVVGDVAALNRLVVPQPRRRLPEDLGKRM